MNKIDKLKKNFVPMLTRGIICKQNRSHDSHCPEVRVR